MRPDLRGVLQDQDLMATDGQYVHLADSGIDKVLRLIEESGYTLSQTIARGRVGEHMQDFQERLKMASDHKAEEIDALNTTTPADAVANNDMTPRDQGSVADGQETNPAAETTE